MMARDHNYHNVASLKGFSLHTAWSSVAVRPVRPSVLFMQSQVVLFNMQQSGKPAKGRLWEKNRVIERTKNEEKESMRET